MTRPSLAFTILVALSGCAGPMNPEDNNNLYGTEATRNGVDYSFARPSPTGIRAAGYTFAVRYLSYVPAKTLSPSEAKSLIAAGLDIVSNWEQNATDALNGYNQGRSDAAAANAQAANCGAPADRPIYFSVDFDATPGQQAAINSYFDGVASVIGHNRTGAYGGYYVIQRLFDAGKIAWGWQAFAWSGGQWDPRAQLRQVQNNVTIAGGACDLDVAEATDFGQWGHAPPPPPPPPPPPAWAGKFESQSWPAATTPIKLECGKALPAHVTLRNVGAKTWDSNTRLGTTEPRDRASRFVAHDWLSPSRPSHVTGTVPPNGTFQFDFTFQGPTGAACVPGTYHEYFNLVQEGVAWFSDAGQGGPKDNLIEATIELSAAPVSPSDMDQPGDGGTLPPGDGGATADLAGSPQTPSLPHAGQGGCSLAADAPAASPLLLLLAGAALALLRRRRMA